jgi:UDP-N-acetylglucosamine 4,6-dehydratase
MFTGKTLLITGGTGSFGNAVLRRFLSTDIGAIRIFSRDEKKQDEMRNHYRNGKIKFFIGDVRDRNSLKNAMYGVDFVFHAAALKQVPSCEFFPMEAVNTNILGANNVLDVAIEEGVKKIICLSTDKAAYPINAMGLTKALMEKVFIARSRSVLAKRTIICGTRYGNVMCSRGSVIPLFVEQIKSGKNITVTEPTMTRFIMSLDEAIDLVIHAFKSAQTGDIMVQKASACTIADLAQALFDIFESKSRMNIIGIRHGEKLYETLLTREERFRALDLGDYFRIPADSRDLNYDDYFIEGNRELKDIEDYNSNNTKRLNIEEIKNKLLEQEYIVNALNNKVESI